MKTFTLLLLLTLLLILPISAQTPYPTYPYVVNSRGLGCLPLQCFNANSVPAGWGGVVSQLGAAICYTNLYMQELLSLSVENCQFNAYLFTWITIQGATTPYEEYNPQTNQWYLIWAQTLQGMEVLYNTNTGQYVEVTNAVIFEDCYNNTPRTTGSGIKPC